MLRPKQAREIQASLGNPKPHTGALQHSSALVNLKNGESHPCNEVVCQETKAPSLCE
jgi:hypothetical protein